MLTQRIANIVFAVILIAACVYFGWLAERFAADGLLASSGLPSKFFPQLLLLLTAGCTLIVLLKYLRFGADSGDDNENVFETPRDALSGIVVLGIAVVGFIAWPVAGFLLTALVMSPLCALAMGARDPVILIAVTVIPIAIYLIFTFLLGVTF